MKRYEIIDQIRELKGVNTSFDYGVELVVALVKPVQEKELMIDEVELNQDRFKAIFKYDKVVLKGFEVAKNELATLINI